MLKSENFIVIQGWMCNELQLKGNDLLVYALIYGFSQDGESMFNGGRNYIAKTFNISLPTVDKSLNNLIEQGLIEKISTEINNVKFNNYKIILGVVKKLYGGSKETLPNNINNNKNDILSKDNISSDEQTSVQFEFGKPKSSKPNLYQNCIALINNFTSDCKVRQMLVNYLDLCMEMKCIRGANQWKGMLNTLEKVYQECKQYHGYCDIIQQSIDHGWKTFYTISDNNYRHYNNSVRENIEKISDSSIYDNENHISSGKEF